MKKPLIRAEKTVYVPMAVDLIHHGHINIIQEARKLGQVTVGLLTDQAIARYKRVPLSAFSERKKVIENIVGVHAVVAQETDDYVPILKHLKPDFFVHGDDWKTGIQAKKRARVIETMRAWNGRVIEPAYTKGISTTKFVGSLAEQGLMPDKRGALLRRLLAVKPFLRCIEATDPLSAELAAEATHTTTEELFSFDALWISPYNLSVSTKKPTACLDLSHWRYTLIDLLERTNKPFIAQLPHGVSLETSYAYTKAAERLGVSAVVLPHEPWQTMREKISLCKKGRLTDAFLLFTELSLSKKTADTLRDLNAHLAAGTDGLVIHSASTDKASLEAFCQQARKQSLQIPILITTSVAAPLSESFLTQIGVQSIIYTDQVTNQVTQTIKDLTRSLLEDAAQPHKKSVKNPRKRN